METIETLNKRLEEIYGIDTITGRPMWRIVWSDTQTEKRLVTHTENGIELLFPEVMECKKYPWIVNKWVLENLVIVPLENEHELPTSKVSYEPIWPYQDKNDGYLYPSWEGTQFVISVIEAAKGEKGLKVKYVDPRILAKTPEEQHEMKQKRVDRIMEELYGDESDLKTDTFNESGSTIIVPNKEIH